MNIHNISLKALGILIVFGLIACKKKDEKTEPVTEEKMPSADFATDKAEYTSGDVIKLINKSSNASFYRWTMPDGQTSKSENVSQPSVSNSFDEQSFTFKLEALSESGNKSDYMVKTIKVKGAYGKLILYSGFLYQNVSFSIDNVPYQTVSVPYSATAPACNQSGFPTYTLTSGTYFLEASGFAGVVWTYTNNIEIKGGECTITQVP